MGCGSSLWTRSSLLCSVASVSSSLLRTMVWAGARAAEVPVFLPSMLCSRWMWNLRWPFLLKLRRGKSRHQVALPGVRGCPLSLAIPGLTAAHRRGMRKASRWYVLACAAADPSCSWRRSCTDCTGAASGLSAVPCEPKQGRGQAPVVSMKGNQSPWKLNPRVLFVRTKSMEMIKDWSTTNRRPEATHRLHCHFCL